MKHKEIFTVLFVGALFVSACASWSWKPIVYSPNPATVENPEEDFKRLVMTAKRWRPTSIEFHPTFASLIYTGPGIPGGITTATLPFNEIAEVKILTSNGEYLVRASSSNPADKPLYEYIAMDLGKAKAFADVLTVLAKADYTSSKSEVSSSSITIESKSSPIIVAVFDLHDTTGNVSADELLNLTNYLGTVLTETGKYQTIPRDQIRARLFDDKKKSYKNCFDESCQIELGKALAAQKSLVPTLLKVGGKCAVTAKLFDLKTETAEKAATFGTECSKQELLHAMKEIAVQLSKS